jgi:hypothetical protein
LFLRCRFRFSEEFNKKPFSNQWEMGKIWPKELSSCGWTALKVPSSTRQ